MTNLEMEGFYLSGARAMLLRLLDCYNIRYKERGDKDDKVYLKAELQEILSSKDATRKFLAGFNGGYYDHCRDKKGKLVSARFMFVSSKREEEKLKELQQKSRKKFGI